MLDPQPPQPPWPAGVQSAISGITLRHTPQADLAIRFPLWSQTMITTRFSLRCTLAALTFALMTPAVHAQEADMGPRPIRNAGDQQANVVKASFLGGSSDEWLAGGGFQPDGTIILAGNVIGNSLNLGARTGVFGRDLPAPAPIADWPNDRRGRPLAPSWEMPQATGFVARLSPDGKNILSVTRLPWQAGAITSALVTDDGTIFIAGRAQNGIVNIGGRHEALRPVAEPDNSGLGSFFARLNPEGTAVEWFKTLAGQTGAPRLELRPDGNIVFFSRDYRVFDPQGRQRELVQAAGSVRDTVAVSPVDGRIARGGERHWRTGREPWRCPTLDIHLPDGSHQFQLYRWPGPYVGLDNSRQVSDSAVRLVRFLRDGSLLYSAWSDGGNSVMTSPPMDVRQGVIPQGLGMTPAGAGVLSIAYLIKAEPQDMQITAWTRFLATRGPNRPNSLWIRSMHQAPDGSLMISGNAAMAVVQTENNINEGPASGSYIAVLSRDMTTLRFSSVIHGAGAAVPALGGNHGWGMAANNVNGRTLALFTGGARAESESYGFTTATPTRSPIQAEFGGGRSDGYFVILDLGPTPNQLAPLPVPERTPPTLTVRNHGIPTNRTANTPEPGNRVIFDPANPRYFSADAEIRVTSDKYWPNFFYGRAQSGELVYRENGAQMQAVILLDQRVQDGGQQHRRILGELMDRDPNLAIRLTIHRLGPPERMEFEIEDRRGRQQARHVTFSPARATLEVGNRRVDVEAQSVINWRAGGRDGITVGARVDTYITLTGRQLGLREPADETIQMRITATANPPR